MFEYLLTILLFLGVMTFTALIFGVWVVVTLLRAVFRGVLAVVAPESLPTMPMGSQGMVCVNNKCKALNIDSARFCRRCGVQFPAAQRVSARRVAMW